MTFQSKPVAARIAALSIAALGVAPAFAQSSAEADEIRAQIQALRAEQARINEQQRKTEETLRALEARLSVPASAAPASEIAAQAAPAAAPAKSKLAVTGDLRLRGQGDYGNQDGVDRKSSQVRARLGATYAVNDRVTIGGRLVSGDADDPNVQAVSSLAHALGLDGDQTFIARVVRTVMAKYEPLAVDDDVAKRFALGMMLAAAADGYVDEEESALLAALARTVPELRNRDVDALFADAKSRMSAGVEAALAHLGGLEAHREKCFALATEVALVAGRGPAGTMLPRLQDRIRPAMDYAECAIATFAAKYAQNAGA